MAIKRGKVEKTMDKAMLILLLVCGALMLLVFLISFTLYKRDMEQYVKLALGDIDISSIKNDNYEPIITDKGEIIINGEIYTVAEAKNYSLKDHVKLGWNLFNRELLSLDARNENIFNSNYLILLVSGVLLIYWITLLIIYEKERKHISTTIMSDEELMKKYNPLIAGCIEGNRDVIHTDIAAVILNLINKKIIDLELIPINEDENFYKYILKRNRSNEVNIGMDEIESYVHSWIFGTGISEYTEIDMVERLKNLIDEKDYSTKLKELKKLAKKKLNSLGANKNKVPVGIRVTNIIIFVSVIFICLIAVWFGLVHFQIDAMELLLMYVAIVLFGFLMPIVIFLTYAGVLVYLQTRRLAELLMNKLFKKELVKMIFLVALMTVTSIVTTLSFSMTPLIIPYEILLCISFLIMKTDNLMIQNDEEIMMDYNRLKVLKDKISNYSLLDRREIEQVTLWKDYMTYAVAFGIALEVMKDTDRKLEKVKPDKEYLKKLVVDTVDAFFEVNF